MDPSTKSADSRPTDQEVAHSPRRSWRPQVSLATLLSLVTIVGLIFGYYVLSRSFAEKISKANAENALLKNQIIQFKKDLAILEVTDPNLIHAVRLPSFEEDTYRFRIHLPPNKKYVLKYVIDAVPKDGFPKKAQSRPIDSAGLKDGNEVGLHRAESTIKLQYLAMTETFGIKKLKRDGMHMSLTGGIERGEVGIQKPDEPLLLVRHRTVSSTTKTSLSEKDFPARAQGVMMWIEEDTTPSTSTTNPPTLGSDQSP